MNTLPCPRCHGALEAGAIECPHCGVIVAKAHRAGDAPPVYNPPPAAARAPKKRWPLAVRIFIMLVLGFGGGICVVGGWAAWRFDWLSRLKDKAQEVAGSTGKVVTPETRPTEAFDRFVRLPAEPFGITHDGSHLILGGYTDPWGLMTVEPEGDRLRIRQVAVTEPRYNQKMSFNGLAWNGEHIVAIAMKSWLVDNGDGEVFALIDPATFGLQGHRDAPDPVWGGIAWDGTGYWVGTRNDTDDDPRQGYLIRLDADFNEVARQPMDVAGCQGLAWDGTHLIWADIFTDELILMTVGGETATPVHRFETGEFYLAGVAFDGEHLWMVRYGDGAGLYRLHPQLKAMWDVGDYSIADASSARSALSPAADDPGAVAVEKVSSAEEKELRRRLRSASESERTSARFELERLGLGVDYGVNENSFAERPMDNMECLALTAELVDGGADVSFTVWTGDDITNGLAPPPGADQSFLSMPLFARVTVTLSGPGGDVEEELDLVGGEQSESVHLSTSLRPGDYSVSLFLHAQYYQPDGSPMILNNSCGTVFLSVK